MTDLVPLRTTLCATTSLALLVTATSSSAQGTNQSLGTGTQHYSEDAVHRWSGQGPNRRPLRINPNFPEVRSAASSLPKGAVHLMVRSDADAQQIFTYFPSPWIAARPGAVGMYRLELDPQGTVAAVTILRSMGPIRDSRIMKTFVTWRAKPGALRVVDISWVMS